MDVASVESWTQFVNELCTLRQRNISFSASQPSQVVKAIADAERVGGSADVLRENLLTLQPPRGPVRLELELQAALWRLEASAPTGAAECGGSLTCTLRATLPAAYPLARLSEGQSGTFEVSASGSLGREASKIVSTAAHAQLAEMRARGVSECLTGIVEWVEATELHELAAASYQPCRAQDSGKVRAFVRFHHVLSRMKRGYMELWAGDLGVSAVLSSGQPAMLLAEGPRNAVQAFIQRATKCPHWGPTPARLVGSAPIAETDTCLPLGLREVAEVFPAAVVRKGTYNGRDCVKFDTLADLLEGAKHVAAANELRALLSTAFAHKEGRVEEASDGSGWVGYACPELTLAELGPGKLSDADKKNARWRKDLGSSAPVPKNSAGAADVATHKARSVLTNSNEVDTSTRRDDEHASAEPVSYYTGKCGYPASEVSSSSVDVRRGRWRGRGTNESST
eukprot:TRINITY_DN56406_c0_g1_i1.p1 TRINITY_DN56406_c0_g1~~TRINITY_DN56406_c0_g1_i1.p1  ORF type:complete len:468 (+),score=24.94 TRINITY_DN56406_c0_g1_i1:45-1406(+)